MKQHRLIIILIVLITCIPITQNYTGINMSISAKTNVIIQSNKPVTIVFLNNQ